MLSPFFALKHCELGPSNGKLTLTLISTFQHFTLLQNKRFSKQPYIVSSSKAVKTLQTKKKNRRPRKTLVTYR